MGQVAAAADEGDCKIQRTNGKKSEVVVEEKDYALLYAYTLVTVQVAEELRKVKAEIENLFGVLNTDELLLE